MDYSFDDEIGDDLIGTNWYCSRCSTEFDERDRGVVFIDSDCVKCPHCGKTLVR